MCFFLYLHTNLIFQNTKLSSVIGKQSRHVFKMLSKKPHVTSMSYCEVLKQLFDAFIILKISDN